jgi:hypothetical protein
LNTRRCRATSGWQHPRHPATRSAAGSSALGSARPSDRSDGDLHRDWHALFRSRLPSSACSDDRPHDRAHYLDRNRTDTFGLDGWPRPGSMAFRTAVPGGSMGRMGSPPRFRRGLHIGSDQRKHDQPRPLDASVSRLGGCHRMENASPSNASGSWTSRPTRDGPRMIAVLADPAAGRSPCPPGMWPAGRTTSPSQRRTATES